MRVTFCFVFYFNMPQKVLVANLMFKLGGHNLSE